MPIGAIAGAVSGGESLLGGIFGAKAANKAAQQEAQAYKQAENFQIGQQNLAVGQQQGTTAAIGRELSPYTSLGQQGSNSLASLLAPGGGLTAGYGAFAAPTAEEAQQTPGYKFQFQQGMNALQNSAAARGGLLSTGTAKNLEQFGQGLASTNYQDAYNRALAAYQTNANTFYTNQNNLYNRLMGATGTGLSATGQFTGLQQQGANSLSNIYMGTGQEVGNEMIGAGQALAGGTVGSSNSLWGGIGGAAGGATNSISTLMGAHNASNPNALSNDIYSYGL